MSFDSVIVASTEYDRVVCCVLQAIKAFFPAIQSAISHQGWLGLHEYSAPHMWSEFDNSTGEGWSVVKIAINSSIILYT